MSRTKLIPGQNDLATTHPTLAFQWHPTKNGDLTPQSVSAGSNKLVWWQCENGHEWQAGVINRTRGAGCPYCNPSLANRLLPGRNDLQTVNPALAAQWHPTKNGDVTPSMVSAHSAKKYWWQCENGHEWQAIVRNRHNGTNCPHCRSWKVRSGHESLASAYPELAAHWHPTKNGSRTPSQIAAGSNQKVWWLCENGHEWETYVRIRIHRPDCIYCKPGHYNRIYPGINDLATANPELSAQWHPTKNGDLTPAQVSATSSQKVWWQCVQGHEWEALVSNRSRGTGCPVCARFKRKK